MVQESLGVELGYHLADQPIEGIEGHLTFMFADNVALGVDEHQGGPSPAGILPPDLKLGVVDHRVFQLVPLHGAIQVAGFLLIGELGRMNSDHG